MESHALGIQRESGKNRKCRFFRRFWVEEPLHLETIFAKKRYTSIVARVFYRLMSGHRRTQTPPIGGTPTLIENGVEFCNSIVDDTYAHILARFLV